VSGLFSFVRRNWGASPFWRKELSSFIQLLGFSWGKVCAVTEDNLSLFRDGGGKGSPHRREWGSSKSKGNGGLNTNLKKEFFLFKEGEAGTVEEGGVLSSVLSLQEESSSKKRWRAGGGWMFLK